MKKSPQIRMRFFSGNAIALGPGKVALLKAVEENGSITKAAQNQGMSYKRAWNLIFEMNSAFIKPLVLTSKGGEKGGGASLTIAGMEVCRLYQEIEEQCIKQQQDNIDKINALLL